MAIINFSSIVSDGITGKHREGNMLLSEGSRDKQLSVYLPLFQKRGIDVSLSQLKQFLLRKFVSEAGMHNLSLGGNYYLSGVARYYFNGDLTSNKRLNALYSNVTDKFIPEVCTKLDALINVLRNAYIDSVGTQFEQPEDFGELKINALFRKYGKAINKELGIYAPKKKEEKQPEVFDHNASKNYTYDILYNYNDARKYKEYTEPGAWCITYGEQHYNTYIRRLGIHYVVFRQNGFENVERRVGPGYTKEKPHDEYGNSLICVLQSNTSPEPVYITSRWNHGSYQDNTSGTEADHAYTTEEFLNVVGCDYSVLERAFKEWNQNKMKNVDRPEVSREKKEKAEFIRKFKYAQMMLNTGQDPNNIFDSFKGYASDDDRREFKLAALSDGHDGYWYTLMYKRKLYYDVFLKHGPYLNGRIELCSKNGAIFVFLEDCYVFDRIRGRFVDIDGKTKFKKYEVTRQRINDESESFIFVCLSGKQIAMIDGETMKPVRAKNGSAWFEAIVDARSSQKTNYDYSNKIKLPSAWRSTQTLYRMIYDSSAGEDYYFDGTQRKFIDLNVPKGFSVYQPYFGVVPREYLLLMEREHYMLLHIESNTFVEMEGTNVFVKLNIYDYVVKFKLRYDEDFYVYDIRTAKPIMLNGKKLRTEWYALRKLRYYGNNLISIGDNTDARIKSWLVDDSLVYYVYDESAYSLCCDKDGNYRFNTNDYGYMYPIGQLVMVDEFFPMNRTNESVVKQDFWKILNGIENSRKLLR